MRLKLKLSSSFLFAFILLALFSNDSIAAENASNPLAVVNNTDVRLQYFDLDGPERYDFWVADGAYMLTPELKLKYELHLDRRIHWQRVDAYSGSGMPAGIAKEFQHQ